MSTNKRKTDPRFVLSYERGMLRSAFVSLFWAVITARKKRSGGFTLQALAKAIGSSKHEVSRWFNGDPNWTLNTIASIAHALDLDLIIQARERSTGIVYTPAGAQVESAAAPYKEMRTDPQTSSEGRVVELPSSSLRWRPDGWTARSRLVTAPETSTEAEPVRDAA